MKKQYIKPQATEVKFADEAIMIASSIQNIEQDTQSGIEENAEDGFEAGAKDNKWGNLWDE